MTDIFEEIVRLRSEGRSSALATIVQCQGSAPQKEGAKMLVRDDGSISGSLGGGCLEAEVIQAALMCLRDGTARTIPVSLTEKHGGLVCGGKVLVYVEPVVPSPHLVILGAGHVGRALATAARFCGFRVTVADDREEYANRASIPDATDLVVSPFDRVFERVPVSRDTCLVIATRGHNHDLDAVKAALTTAAGYVGLLGSRRKKALLFKALREAGFADSDIERVIVPVGLAINSITPEEISISIMAQIIQHRRGHGNAGLGAAPCGGLVEEDRTTQAAPAP